MSHPLVRPRFVDDHAPVSPNAVDRRRCGRNWHRDPGSLRWLIRFVVPGTAVATENEAQSGSGLQLQHVLLGFVSAYVLVRRNEAAITSVDWPTLRAFFRTPRCRLVLPISARFSRR